jgi:DNA polymerase III subunit delta
VGQLNAYKSLIGDIRSGDIKPLYLLIGEESFFCDALVEVFEHEIVPEPLQSFNVSHFYGKECNGREIADAAMRMPMMAERQVVIVRDADLVKDFEGLTTVVKRPVPSTVLVFVATKKLDARNALKKQLAQIAEVYETPKLYENHMPGIAKELLEDAGLSFSPEIPELLAEFIGVNVSGLYNEVQKLKLVLGGEKKTKIIPHHIEEFIGFSKEFSVFELQKALAERNKVRAFAILNNILLHSKSNNPIATISILFNFVYKAFGIRGSKEQDKVLASIIGVNPFLLKDYKTFNKNYNLYEHTLLLEALLHYDLMFKGVMGDKTPDASVLFEMISIFFTANKEAIKY